MSVNVKGLSHRSVTPWVLIFLHNAHDTLEVGVVTLPTRPGMYEWSEPSYSVAHWRWAAVYFVGAGWLLAGRQAA